MGGPSPGHCEPVSGGEILLPFLPPRLKGRLREHWVKGRMLLWVRNHLRANRRKNYAGFKSRVKQGCVWDLVLHSTFVRELGEKKGKQMNSKTCNCLRYLWISQEKRWKTSQGFSPTKLEGWAVCWRAERLKCKVCCTWEGALGA